MCEQSDAANNGYHMGHTNTRYGDPCSPVRHHFFMQTTHALRKPRAFIMDLQETSSFYSPIFVIMIYLNDFDYSL